LAYLIHRRLYHEAIKERDKKRPMDCRLGIPSEKPKVDTASPEIRCLAPTALQNCTALNS